MNEVLDMQVVEELMSLSDDGDPELLLDLIKLFLDDGPDKVAAIEQGLAKGDFEMMERAAHALKGSAGNLGARLLQGICEQLQLATRQHRLGEVQQLTPQLQRRFTEAKGALQALQTRYS
jgi:HPt (histidine-containing phosphotransfer) domain-containing protein